MLQKLVSATSDRSLCKLMVFRCFASYSGTLPLYDSHDKEFQAVIRRMYLEATFNLYDFNAIETRFDKATIIIEHHFKENWY
ncbi:hypothetical protein [Neobacillus sp. 19]|uniref:hypothetical protein n=1 Tax=Neobacillus sp. 19 TaxID=3394458 RepID=UPI003BF6F7BB